MNWAQGLMVLCLSAIGAWLVAEFVVAYRRTKYFRGWR